MNQTLPTCARCATSFWPNGRLSLDPRQHFCDSCMPGASGVALSAEDSYDDHQVTRSTRNQSLREIIQGNSKALTPPSRPRILARELPQTKRPQPRPVPKPALPQTLAFNCPACMAILNISRDLAIAGTTAPCPHCASMVIPPRIAPAAARKPLQQSPWHPARGAQA